MVTHVRMLVAGALGLQAGLAPAATPPTIDERIVPMQASAQLAEFERYAKLAPLVPGAPGAPELRVWRYAGMFFSVSGNLFADGRLRGVRIHQAPHGNVHVDEFDQPMAALPVAVLAATRALAAYDQQASDCDIADGETIAVQASIDGRMLLLQASTPRSCHGEMSSRVTALLRAIDALEPD